jgi:EmrB/QacA subfamily drug resistance transporter
MAEREEVVQRSTEADGNGGGAPQGGASGASAGGATSAVRSPEAPAAGPPDAGGAGGAGHSRWLLIVCCVAQFMVILDLSIVNVALPSIQSSLNFSQASLPWVIDAYAITFAGFLMLGGRASDHFGQRRTFVVALILFSIASLAGGAAATREMLVIARAVQGLAGALMAATSLAIITSSFPQGPQRHRAIGLWGAMNGAGGAAGVLFGGIITQALTWRWVLLINPPIGIVAALIAWRVVADRRRARGDVGFDLPGALSLTIGQMVLVYGVVEAGVFGWGSPHALVPIIIGLAILALFGLIETRFAKAPLVPFKDITRPLAVANTIVLLFSGALFPMWFVGSLYLQQVLGLSPLHTGLAFLPMALMIMFTARSAGKIVGRFGVRTVLGGGLVMMTVALLLFARIQPSGSAILFIVVPGLLMAAGIGFAVVPSTIAATQGAKEGQAGLASGLVNTSRQVGAGLGLAVLITLATQLTTQLIGNNHPVPSALTDGFRLAYLIAAGLTAAAAVVTFTMIPAAGSARKALSLIAGIAAAVVVVTAVSFATANKGGSPLGAYSTDGAYAYVTAPNLHPPIIKPTQAAATNRLAPGYIFVANFYDITRHPMIGQSGPLILDRNLQPVWFRPVPTAVVASNLSLQRFEGKPTLSWWQGTITNTGATETGEDIVVNQHYQTVATLKGKDGWVPTLHEMIIRGDDAWVTANKDIPLNLSQWGGAYNGALTDSAVQEYNLKTGQLLRTWDALGHISLDDSYASLPDNAFPWDAYHVNSLQLVGNDRFLVSMRNTWSTYMVNINTGQIQWILGGKRSNFKLGPGADFQWQHDVRLQGNSTISMFDDHCCQITGGGTYVSPTGPSRGLVLKLDQATRTATVDAQYSHGSGFDADYMGDTQPLPNGNVFVGWGSEPNLSEYSSSGQLLMDAAFPGPDLTYRATLNHWVGLPLDPPVGAARQTNGKVTVYASWNGSTQVAAWEVLAGSSASSLTRVAAYAKSGFETSIPVPQTYPVYEVVALSAQDHVIEASQPFSVSK